MVTGNRRSARCTRAEGDLRQRSATDVVNCNKSDSKTCIKLNIIRISTPRVLTLL
jgi:hypothetical protein